MSATWAPKIAATRYVCVTQPRLVYEYGVASPRAILALGVRKGVGRHASPYRRKNHGQEVLNLID